MELSRTRRKAKARIKINSAMVDITNRFQAAFEDSKDWHDSVKTTEAFINVQMNLNPQENHIWISAAMEWAEKLGEIIREFKKEEELRKYEKKV